MIPDFKSFIDLQTLTTRFIGFVPNLLAAIILFFLFWSANKVIQKMIHATLSKMRIEMQAINLLLRAARYGIYVFAFLTIADQLQINIKSLLAGVGFIGLALSFAAQDTVGNLISGIVIIIDRPFKEGDWIILGSMHATVTQIRLRTTVLTTFDNETVVVPNKQISQERIVNYTMTPRIRVKIPIGIAYKEDITQARTVLLATLKGDDRISLSPEPVVIVSGLGDSSVNLQLRFWIDDPLSQYAFVWEYTEKCKQALDKAGIEIPFPHLQLFVEKIKSALG
ncbi:MAG: mechanosensitive ion channel [Desulfobacula sp.]|nr:mechanosensitive ion channel [Desulfobacula sp.]